MVSSALWAKISIQNINPPLHGRGTIRPSAAMRQHQYFNPPTPWGGGTVMDHVQVDALQISIPPLRGGGTGRYTGCRLRDHNFNPPTPWGVGPPMISTAPTVWLFQSTHPVGGGTSTKNSGGLENRFQSTHPVGGGTSISSLILCRKVISIHPPRGAMPST